MTTKARTLYAQVDWQLFRQQKEWLAEQDGEHAAGLLELCDSLLDQAIELGYAEDEPAAA